MSDPAITAWEPTRLRRGRVAATLLLFALALVPDAGAGKKKAPAPPLPALHSLPAGGFAFRTPEAWKVVSTPENPDTLNASGDGVAVRFVYHEGETGYDSFHGACMLERLAGAMEMEPVVQYEYDFVGGVIGDRRALDSAFVVTYDKPILGERQWRQRSVSIVGNGTSLCAVTYAPVTVWKKSAPTRALLDAVLASVTFR